MHMIPRPEHPRPQFVREHWQNLNGTWQFTLDQGESGQERKLYLQEAFAERIVVPFCPESRLSGIGHTDFIRGCWYKRTMEISESWQRGRVLLHFGAVYYQAKVWVNGQLVGSHKGGHSSFTLDITDAVHAGENALTVYARSDVRSRKQPVGKQSVQYASAGCSYTRTTGIWQTVWLESVPATYMEKIFLTPDTANCGVEIRCTIADYIQTETLQAEAFYDGRSVGKASCQAQGREARLFVPLSEEHLWEIGKGRLYDLTITLGEDRVQSYFGLRSVSLENGSFCLNGKPVFQRTVLDQGFNPEGIITAPDDGHLKRDIQLSMAMGFNGARLHQKIFEPRFLHWADKMGYIVWGEHGNWGLDVGDGEGLLHFLPEWVEAVERDYSSPALIGWCPFNETDPNTQPLVLSTTYQVTRSIDRTRPVIDTSGWVHCESTDIYDYHNYDQNPVTFRKSVEAYACAPKGALFARQNPDVADRRPRTTSKGQPIFISEYGGIGWQIGTTPNNSWGYGTGPKSEEEFITRFGELADACLSTKGIMGLCYTQLTDVEQEINGLYTYDRQEKFPASQIRPLLTKPAWNETAEE